MNIWVIRLGCSGRTSQEVRELKSNWERVLVRDNRRTSQEVRELKSGSAKSTPLAEDVAPRKRCVS